MNFIKRLLAGTGAFAILASAPISAYAVAYDSGYVITSGNNTTTAPIGQIGEVETCAVLVGAPVTLATTATGYNLCSISLTAGRWMCIGQVLVNTPAGTTMPQIIGAWNTVTATIPTAGLSNGLMQGVGSISAAATGGGAEPIAIVLVSTTPSTEYLNMSSSFTGTAPNAFGNGVCVRLG